MVKKLILIFLFLLPVVVAENITINKGDEVTISGKILKLENVGEDKAIINVDGVTKIISLNKPQTVNGLTLNLFEVIIWSEQEKSVRLYVTIPTGNKTTVTKCGNEKCETDEEGTCCIDCSCDKGYTCVDNKCLKNECEDDENCYDTDYCTKDKCEGKPKKCVRTPIITCVVNDKCCPADCYYPNDPDCPATKINPNQPVTEGIKENISNVSQQIQEEQKEPQEESFFNKMINWFLNIFR